MNELDYQEAYHTLETALKSNGLEWVTVQVAEHIRMGKTIQREIDTLTEDQAMNRYLSNEFQYQFRKGPRATFPAVVNYEPHERLELLINAIEMVVIDTAQIESEVIADFKSKWNNHLGIQFFADEPGLEPRSLTSEISKSRLENSSRLRELLDLLKKEVRE